MPYSLIYCTGGHFRGTLHFENFFAILGDRSISKPAEIYNTLNECLLCNM